MPKAPGPEEQLHRAVVQHLHFRGARCLWWHSANQRGSRKRWEMGLLKALGQRAGVPDLTFVQAGPKVRFLELKAKGNKPTEEQRAFGMDAEMLGCDWEVADNIDRAIEILEAWGVLKVAR